MLPVLPVHSDMPPVLPVHSDMLPVLLVNSDMLHVLPVNSNTLHILPVHSNMLPVLLVHSNMLPVLPVHSWKLNKKIKANSWNCLGKGTIVICSGFIWAPNTSSSHIGPKHVGEILMGSSSNHSTVQHDKREIFRHLFELLIADI